MAWKWISLGWIPVNRRSVSSIASLWNRKPRRWRDRNGLRDQTCFGFSFSFSFNPSRGPSLGSGHGTLADLHDDIQAAFGWKGGHLHLFEIDGETFGPEDDDSSEEETVMTQLIANPRRKAYWAYVYDFGDNWVHQIVFEGIVKPEAGKRYPLCVAGKRAGPPEDVGGPWAYAEFLQAIEDPKHPDHQEMMEWSGGHAADQFDAATVSKAMRKVRRRRR